MGISDRVKLNATVPAAAKTLNELANPKVVSADKALPAFLLKNCMGLAFITIYKAGFLVIGGNLGGGFVIVKVPDANEACGFRWSPPLSVNVGGLGGGFVLGGEKISSVVVLNTRGAIEGFKGQGQVSFGGSLSLAAGPVGRDAAAQLSLSDTKELAPAYSYSIAKGAYVGASLEGAVLKVNKEDNANFYGRPGISGEEILSGSVKAPLVCNVLYEALNECTAGQSSAGKVSSTSNMGTSGKQLLMEGLGGAGSHAADNLPPGWQTLYTPEGKAYYLNTSTNQTQWEKPAPPRPAPPPPAPPPPPPPATLPPGWEELKTPEGKPYYFNRAKNTTQWERP